MARPTKETHYQLLLKQGQGSFMVLQIIFKIAQAASKHEILWFLFIFSH